MLLWATYGFWINSLPIILANVITFALIIVLLAMKIRYK
jgi:MtN3 and saliva related transmembrane protein